MSTLMFLAAIATTTGTGLTLGHLLGRRQRRLQAHALIAATQLINTLRGDIDRLTTALTNRNNPPPPPRTSDTENP